MPFLLQEPGDFLLRCSDVPMAGNARKLILSACIDGGDGVTNRVLKHVVIQSVDAGKYCVDDKGVFTTVDELCQFYVKKELSPSPEFTQPIRKPIQRQWWELDHNDIQLTTKLGEGAFGVVYAGTLTVGNKQEKIAIKKTKQGAMSKDKIKEYMVEARFMRNYDHPNIVKLYGVAVLHEPLMIVMEFINGGSMDHYLQKNPTTSFHKRLDLIVGSAYGLEYLHNKNYLHCDIAARNILLNNEVPKISDFGLTCEGPIYTLKVARMVPIKWSAPETISQLIFTAYTDIWSFGVLVYEAFAGHDPYLGMSNAEVKEKVANGYKLPFPESTPFEIVELVHNRMWAARPEDRFKMPAIAEALSRFAKAGGKTPSTSPQPLDKSSRPIAVAQSMKGRRRSQKKARKTKEKKT